MSSSPSETKTATHPVFPEQALEQRLRRQLEKTAAHARLLRGEWEPVLDSLAVVAVVIELEEILKFELPPESIVRKGGYDDVDDAVRDILANVERLWDKHYATGD